MSIFTGKKRKDPLVQYKSTKHIKKVNIENPPERLIKKYKCTQFVQ